MENNFQSTIDAVVDTARDIATKVGDAAENVVENVVETIGAVTETIDTVKDTAEQVVDASKEMPSFNDILKAILKDSRVGHFIIDILSGKDAKEASSQYFPSDNMANEVATVDIDTLVNEAEERGYLRGRNEQIEVKMREPSQWQRARNTRKPVVETTILNHPRRSVWEN